MPAPSLLSEPFWSAAARRELVSPLCGACGSRFFIPEPICPRCGQAGWTWSPSPGRGVIESFTVVHRSPDPDLLAPYVLAVVDLDDGWTMLTRLVGDTGALRIGAAARVCFTPVSGPGTPLIPTFALAEGGG
jgi:uncharacterized OB-fold protein